jgi:hypothetical protein
MTSPPFRVETVPVRRAGRGPVVIAALAATLVAVSIVKPWSSGDPGTVDHSRDFASPGAVAIRQAVDAPTVAIGQADHAPAASAAADSRVPGQVGPAPGIVAAESAPPAPGQVACGSSGWELVTLGSFLRWTVRTLTAITPVEAKGPGDPSIPVLSLGESDVAGVGACAPSISPVAPGRASTIVAAWLRDPSGPATSAATAPPGANAPPVAAERPGAASAPANGGTATAVTWERMTLAQLDALPAGGPAAAHPTADSLTELFRPIPATQHNRWPAGRYVLLLASPDAGTGFWIAIDIGGGS